MCHLPHLCITQADHYSLLMRTLENFAALTAGSAVRVTDGRRVYNLDVLEVRGKENQRDDSNGLAVDLGLCELAFDIVPPKVVCMPREPSAHRPLSFLPLATYLISASSTLHLLTIEVPTATSSRIPSV